MAKEKSEPSAFQAPGKTKLVKGSILQPHNAGLRFVLSVNNLAGKPDNNPLYPVFEKKWPKVKQEARGFYANKTGSYKLGAVFTTAVQSDVWVIHCLCQDESLKTDASALGVCLEEVRKLALYEKSSVHVSTLLTDAIPELNALLNKELVRWGVSVLSYEEE
jgi:hypothetical protein